MKKAVKHRKNHRLGHVEDALHRSRQHPPRGGFVLQLTLPCRGEFVVLCAAIVFGHAPLRPDPASPFQSMQCGIQRPLLDLQNVSGDLSDPFRYPPAVLRFEFQGLEDQEIQSALWKVDACH